MDDVSDVSDLLLDSTSPADLDLPPKFDRWRRPQMEAVEEILGADKQYVALSMPTGSGKSLAYVAAALLADQKVVCLTATKGLQSQLLSDFASVGMVDVRGMSNYRCRMNPRINCEQGDEQGCQWSGSLCPYSTAVNAAKTADLVDTNYQYWLNARRYQTGSLEKPGRPVGMLVLDEAGQAPEELGRFLREYFRWSELPGFKDEWKYSSASGLMHDATGSQIRNYFSALKSVHERDLQKMREEDTGYAKDPDYKRRKKLVDRLAAARVMDSNWVWQPDAHGIALDPISPARYSAWLWSGVQKVVLVSGTLRPYTLRLLGLSRDKYKFREWPRSFPPNRSPVIHIPTARMSKRSTDTDYQKVLDRVDAIIEGRLDRKGIIHTVSYKRQEWLVKNSRYGRYMVWNARGDAVQTVEEFRRRKAPAILVSPSFSTGYDFMGDQCEYQIVVKIPFPDASSRLMQERCKDKQYLMYTVMQELVQMCGRGTRSEVDRCETFVLDDHVKWLLYTAKTHAPSWFSVRSSLAIPSAPPKL